MLVPLYVAWLIAGALISLVEVGRAPAWMVVVILGREFAVTGLRAIAAEQGIAIAAREWGKVKMVVQVVCITALLLSQGRDAPSPEWLGQMHGVAKPLGDALLWGTVLVSAISAIDYFWLFWGLFEKKAAEPESGGEEE